MKVKHLLITALALVMASSSLFAGETDAAVQKELQELRQMLKQQNDKIKSMESRLDTSAAGLAQVSDDAVVSLGNGSSNLAFKGDLRVRYEQRDRADNPNGVERFRRFRHRFRLGMTWKSDQNWTLAAGLATGGNGGTSTNDTWNDDSKGAGSEWETGDIRLDYAYATHKWGSTSLSIGQQKNPYTNAGILFDSYHSTGIKME